MSDASECDVCCAPYTNVVRKKVACCFCGTAACASCMQQYLLTLQGDAHCMNPECKRAFDFEFLSMHLPKTWLLTKYRTHREGVLLEREMALLPATQDVLENYKYAGRLEEIVADAERRRQELQDELREVSTTLTLTRNELWTLRQNNYTRRFRNQGEDMKTKRQFIRACPVEGCRGFLSTAWKCGTCDVWVCKDCGEVKGEREDGDHVCNPDVAASHALLQKDSRPCPQCAAMIYKLEGCDQMFCTQCNVAFSWRTGALVTNGVIHNPHYYEWLRRTRGEVPRNPGDVPCGGLPDGHLVNARLRHLGTTVDTSRKVRNVHRMLNHVTAIELPRLRQEAQVGNDRNVDLRLQYLLNQIDRDTWRRKLQQREKKRERSFAVMQVYDMFSAAATDFFREFVNGERDVESTAHDLSALQQFANDSLAAIAKRFNMKTKRLRDD